MSWTDRIKTRKGIVDVYQFPRTNEVELAWLRRNGMGYRRVTKHPLTFAPGKTIGFSRDPNFDWIVADEPLGFVGVNQFGWPAYMGPRSGGKVVLSGDQMPDVLDADSRVKIHGENML
jgi:hypothetical protein